MKYEIKQLNDTDAVVISDEEITYNNYVFSDGLIGKYSTNDKKFLYLFIKDKQIISRLKKTCKKIIATISPFKLEGLPMLELPNQEEDVEKLFKDKYKSFRTGSFLKQIKEYYAVQLMMIGYKAAQKQYSEEDMVNAFIEGSNSGVQFQSTCEDDYGEAELYAESDLEYFKQSLQKKQFPTSVELEVEQKYVDGVTDGGRIRRFYGKEDFKIIKWHYE